MLNYLKAADTQVLKGASVSVGSWGVFAWTVYEPLYSMLQILVLILSAAVSAVTLYRLLKKDNE